MLARIDLRGSALPGTRELAGLLPRAGTDIDSVMATVRPLCEDVRIRGAQAVREITARLDGVDAADFAVPQEALDRALAECDPALRAALEEAIRRVRAVHADQRRTDVTTQVVPGGTVTERWLPVRRVGLYVPGGLAPLLSSVVMNVVPAQIAGVESIAVASPPQRDHGGLPDPGVLAACALLGVTEVYAVGGAQADRRLRLRRGLLRAGRHGDRAGQRLRHGGQAAAARADRHRLRGRAHRGRDPRRRHRRPRARRRRPDQPGRARPAGRGGAGDRPARRWPTPSSELVPGQVAATKHSDRITHRPRRHAVGHRARRRHRRRAAGRRRLRRRAPGDPDAGRARGRDAGPQRRRDLRRPLVAGLARRLLRRLQPRAAHRRLRPALERAVACSRSCAASTSSSTTEQALAEVAGHIDALAGAEDLPAHAAAVRVRQSGRSSA